MSTAELPGVEIRASGNTIQITLPPSDQSVIPTIPEELRDREIPPFVVEWLLESEEIATVVQELLQAPTKSLCRMWALPTVGGSAVRDPLQSDSPLGPLQGLSPTPRVIRANRFDVSGFGAEPATIRSLPEGIKLPREVLHILIMARKVDAWLTKGQRVLEWSAEEGVPDASWMPATTTG